MFDNLSVGIGAIGTSKICLKLIHISESVGGSVAQFVTHEVGKFFFGWYALLNLDLQRSVKHFLINLNPWTVFIAEISTKGVRSLCWCVGDDNSTTAESRHCFGRQLDTVLTQG